MLSAQVVDVPISINWSFVDNKYVLDDGFDEEGYLYVPITNFHFQNKMELQLRDINYIDISEEEIPSAYPQADSLYYSIEWFKQRSQWRAFVKISPIVVNNKGLSILSSFSLSGINRSTALNTILTQENQLFASESVLSTSKWAKLSIDKSGVYKIDYNLLSEIANSLSLDVQNINPQHIAIYGQRGGMLAEKNSEYNSDDLVEIAIEVNGESDSKFDNDDSVVFYAEGPNSWSYNTSSKLASHKTNVYSDFTYVFITFDKLGAKRISTNPSKDLIEDITVDYFNDFAVHELEENNLIQSGQQWFGERLDVYNNLDIVFEFPNRDLTKEVNIKSSLVSRPDPNTSVDYKANNTSLFNISIGSSSDYRQSTRSESHIIPGESDISINITHNTGVSSVTYLDYIELNVVRELIVEENQFSFRNFDIQEAASVAKYNIQSSTNFKDIWNISDPLNPRYQSFETNSTNVSFIEELSELQEYQVLTDVDYYVPSLVSHVENQNLHSLGSYDYIIITKENLIESANELANFHRSKGLSVVVVDIDQIYNEFSSGRQDLIAVRQFVRMVYMRGSESSRLKYLLMFGDASYDFKDRVDDNTNVVPAYQSWASLSKSSSFVSDDYFGFMDEHEGENITSNDMLDIAVGRIPVNNSDQASSVVSKIVNYNTINSFGDWRNKIQFVADDVQKDFWEIKLLNDSEKLSSALAERNPNFNHLKVYLDAYLLEKTSGGSSSPQAHYHFMENIQSGNLITNYFGHGNETRWTSEGLFSIDDISKFRNNNNLPLFITVTCEFSRYDNPSIYTAGEEVLLFAKGGGVGLISTTREITVSFGSRINESILEYLLPEEGTGNVSIGEALMLAKNDYPAYRSRRTVSLLGDPALKLAYSARDIAITQLNYQDLGVNDTIKSLMTVNVKGEVRKGGVVDGSFNGIVYPQVYDKIQNLKTIDNNNFGIELDYWLQNKIVYKGQATVNEGVFEVEFVVPKDINYAYGASKLSFYAQSNSIDAAGANDEIVLGSIDTGSVIDSEGPELSVYMNNEFFIDGGLTNASPRFVAEIFDESGVNTVGNGIGHDLTLVVLTDANENRIIVNDFYTSDLDSYQKGKLEYQFIGLEEGEYQLEFIAWDVYNNSTRAYLNFYVKEEDENSISGVYNQPNPFNNDTTFKFAHNQADSEFNVIVEVYTINGNLVKTINERIYSEGFVIDGLNWDSKSDSGSLLPSGTYIYKVYTLSSEGSVSNTEVNKFIIIR